MRRTKIVCTIGPATDSFEKMQLLLRAGMDVARLNFSHGNHEEHGRRIQMLREAAAAEGKNLAIMLDTKGPEIRIGTFSEGRICLHEGDRFVLTTRDVVGSQEEVLITYKELPLDVRKDSRILLADGTIELCVEEVINGDIVCKVVNGGILSDRKGVNVPGIPIRLPAITPHDIADIQFGIQQKVDFIAASFVSQAGDVLTIRRILEDLGADIDIVSKIERYDAVQNLDEIIRVSDGVMVARGDLGVELQPEEVPLIQKTIIDKCNKAGKPVITATQMLESMTSNPRPTRAETSDVANAIFDGSDAIMLSGETAAGEYPIESVQTMARIATRTESAVKYDELLIRKGRTAQRTVTDSISYATCQAAEDLGASAIITATTSGHTARMISKYRPRSPIIAVTPLEKVVRKLSLVWGVTPLRVDSMDNTDEMIETAVNGALATHLVKPGDLVIITAGVPLGITGSTNLLKVHTVGSVIVRGTGIGTGSVTAKVRIVKKLTNALEDFQTGEILVVNATDREFIPLIEKAAAVITEEGGLTSHGAIVCLNLGIPVIVGVDGATSLLQDGMTVTLDISRGLVYKGHATIR
jgi:pyruvate kinase